MPARRPSRLTGRQHQQRYQRTRRTALWLIWAGVAIAVVCAVGVWLALAL
jgi:type VI protein secretion system component VasF